MFKRHVYTCPDVIYIINRQRKINAITFGVSTILLGAFWMWADHAERKIDLSTEELQES